MTQLISYVYPLPVGGSFQNQPISFLKNYNIRKNISAIIREQDFKKTSFKSPGFTCSEPLEHSISFKQFHVLIASVVWVYESFAKNKRLNIVPIIDMPENISLAIPFRVAEIILKNLLSNAIKCSNAGGKVIISLKTDNNNPSARATLSVKDYGNGMDEQMFKKLRSNKTASSTNDQEMKLGIELNIVCDLINDFDLQHDVKSNPGCGTEFSVQMPINAS